MPMTTDTIVSVTARRGMLPAAEGKAESSLPELPEVSFWSAEGLAYIAELIEAEIKRRGTQRSLAVAVNMSATTLKNLRSNKHGTIISEPDPATLAKLAPFIVNPETEMGFLAEEFIAIAKGAVKPNSLPSVKEYVEERMDALGVELVDMSNQLAIPIKLLEQFVEDHSQLDYPQLSRVIILFGSAIGYPTYLAQLCGIDLGFEPESE